MTGPKDKFPMCDWHKPMKLGYFGWFLWAEQQIKEGKEQKQCPVCKRFLFPSEWGKEPKKKKEKE